MENFSFRSSVKKYVNGSILLIFATVAAFIVANLDATSEWYRQAFDQPVSLSVGKFNIFSSNKRRCSIIWCEIETGTTNCFVSIGISNSSNFVFYICLL